MKERPKYLPDHLSEEQLEAILHRGSPLLIVAGPGSGKTEVISWRAVHLIRSGAVEPDNLLVTTFTNRAADQLKDRIQFRLPDVNVGRMQVSTIHSFCAELLRRHRRLSPLPRGFRILDSEGQLLFVYAMRKALGLDEIVKGLPHDFYSDVLQVFNLATEELVDPEALAAWCDEHREVCEEKENGLWEERHAVAEAYRRYSQLLGEKSLADFAFLQRHALTLVQEHADLQERLQEQYQEILVDEYQDTNAAQDRLIDLLAGDAKRLTVVGDDDQSIYRFRGATVRNILSFKKRHPEAHQVELTRNFRSLKPIVERSRRVIERNEVRISKDLRHVRRGWNDILLVYEESVEEEARAIARQLERLHKSGYIRDYGDVAILLRSVRSYAQPYADALRAAGIPCHVEGDAGFFGREEIGQLYDLFSFISASKPWGDRFLRHPIVGLQQSTQDALSACKENLLEHATDAALRELGIDDGHDRRKLLSLLELKEGVQQGSHASLIEVLYGLLAATGCVVRFEQDGDAEALANIGLLTQLVARWDEFGSSRNFYPFQHYLKLLRDGGVDPVTVPPEGAVQVMTIHQAKGLEFPVVVLASVMNGRLPVTGRRDRYEIPYALRASGEPEVTDTHFVDERKLFYVAVTRARDLLILGTADVVRKKGGGPSTFLHEMFGENLRAVADVTQARLDEITSPEAATLPERSRYAFSDLAYYLQCPMRYKFAVVYGFAAPWMDPIGFGANVHRALDVIHQRALGGEMVSEEQVEPIVDEVWLSGLNVKEEQDARVRAAAVKQIRRYLREHGDALARAVRAEDRFDFDFEGRVLRGQFDLLRKMEDGKGVELVDFKTSNALDLAQQGIDLQLDLYAMGVEADLRLPVALETAHFLADGERRTLVWSTQRKGQARGRLLELIPAIEREDYHPTATYCRHCDEFRSICAYASGQGKGGEV